MLGIPSDPNLIIKRPWTIITYMFAHFKLFHLLINMIFLYTFGKLFLKFFSNRKLFSNYILGGISGALFFIIFSVNSDLITEKDALVGSSASILSILVTSIVFTPDYSFKIFKDSNNSIKIKFVAIIFILYSIIYPIYSKNIGGLISHIGGIFYGVLYIVLIKKDINLAHYIEQILEFNYSKKNKIVRKKNEDDYEYNTRKKIEEIELNKILEKISKSGYKSLSKKEKKILKKYSQN